MIVLTLIKARNPPNCKSVLEILLEDPSRSKCTGFIPHSLEKYSVCI